MVTTKSLRQYQSQLSCLFTNFILFTNLSKPGHGESDLQYLTGDVAGQSSFHPYLASIQSNVPQLWASRPFSHFSAVLAHFSQFLPHFTRIHSDVATVFSDVASVQSDVANVANISCIQPDVTELESHVPGLCRCRSQTDLAYFATVLAHLSGV